MAGRHKDIWSGTIDRIGALMTTVGVRVNVRLSLAKFPGRVVSMDLTVQEARKWADALNKYADKAESYGTGK